MKLGIKVDENGRLIAMNAETGEAIEGQVSLKTEGGVKSETRCWLEFLAHDVKGNVVIG